MARTFVALWPPAPAARALGERAREAAATHGGRAMPAADLHVTLAFIGELAAEAAGPLAVRLRSALQGACPRPDDPIVLDRLGSFRGANVVWLGASSPPGWLAPLAAAVRAELDAAGVAYDPKPFAPHLTVARGARAPAAAIEPLEVRGWRVALACSAAAAAAAAAPAPVAAAAAASQAPRAGRYRVVGWLDAGDDGG